MGSFSPDFVVGGWAPVAPTFTGANLRGALGHDNGKLFDSAEPLSFHATPAFYPHILGSEIAAAGASGKPAATNSGPVYSYRSRTAFSTWTLANSEEPMLHTTLGDTQRPAIPVMRAEILRSYNHQQGNDSDYFDGILMTRNSPKGANNLATDLHEYDDQPVLNSGQTGWLSMYPRVEDIRQLTVDYDSPTPGFTDTPEASLGHGMIGNIVGYYASGARNENTAFHQILQALFGINLTPGDVNVGIPVGDDVPAEYQGLWAQIQDVLAPYIGNMWPNGTDSNADIDETVLSDAIGALARWAGFVPAENSVDGESSWGISAFGPGGRNGRPIGTLAHRILWSASGDTPSRWPGALRALIPPAAQLAYLNSTTQDDLETVGKYIYGTDAAIEPYVFYESQSFQVVARMDYLYLKKKKPTGTDDDWEYRVYYDINLYLVNKTPLLNVSTGATFSPDSGGDGPALAGGLYSFLDFYDGTNMELGRANKSIMMQIFKEYRSEAELFVAAQQISDALDPLQDPDPPLTKEAPESAVQKLIKRIFPTMEMELRLAYLTPETRKDSPEGQTMFAFMANNASAVDAYKSYFPYFTQTDGDDFFAHIATDKKSEIDIRDQMFSEEFANFLQYNATESGFERFLATLYSTNRIGLAKQLALVSSDIFGPYQPVDIARILQYLYLAGEIQNWFSIFKNKDIFTDTKAILVLALQAAFAGDDYTATSNCDVSALQNSAMDGLQGAMTPFANMGQSFMNKMLKETPKHILKGVCELVEPHVIISKQVRNVSKQVFNGIAMGERMADSAASMADAMRFMAEGSAPAGCADDAAGGSIEMPPVPRIPITMAEALAHIQGQIDSNYPPGMPDHMKPQVSEQRGIELEGTLPLVLMVPPITPFGIIYLLLQLMDFPTNEIRMATSEECSNDSNS